MRAHSLNLYLWCKQSARIVTCMCGKGSTVLLVFSVTPFKIDQNKIKTIRQLKSRIWEMDGGKYTKTLAKIWVEGIIRIRGIRRNILPTLEVNFLV